MILVGVGSYYATRSLHGMSAFSMANIGIGVALVLLGAAAQARRFRGFSGAESRRVVLRWTALVPAARWRFVVAVDVWARNVTARVDLTVDRMYTLSEQTRAVCKELAAKKGEKVQLVFFEDALLARDVKLLTSAYGDACPGGRGPGRQPPRAARGRARHLHHERHDGDRLPRRRLRPGRLSVGAQHHERHPAARARPRDPRVLHGGPRRDRPGERVRRGLLRGGGHAARPGLRAAGAGRPRRDRGARRRRRRRGRRARARPAARGARRARELPRGRRPHAGPRRRRAELELLLGVPAPSRIRVAAGGRARRRLEPAA